MLLNWTVNKVGKLNNKQLSPVSRPPFLSPPVLGGTSRVFPRGGVPKGRGGS